MGISILSNYSNTEAVIVNDSVLPAQPLPAVFYSADCDVEDLVREFIDWLKPEDVRKVTDPLGKWQEFMYGKTHES